MPPYQVLCPSGWEVGQTTIDANDTSEFFDNIIDAETSKYLEDAIRKLVEAEDCNSKLKKYLTRDV